MKKILLISSFFTCTLSFAQTIDTLAIQDFETAPMLPVWNFTGPVVYNSMGTSSATAAPANSPTGINNSRSWETTAQGTGIVLTFDTILIPSGYDSIRVHFNLAAMSLISTSGGPDELDYLTTEVSVDSGAYYTRLRITGAIANNSYWPFSATGVAKVYYQPQTQATFLPAGSGLQTAGPSNCEIVFPGSVKSISIRMKGRSSSSSDTWLVDNVVITGETIVSGIHDFGMGEKIKIYPNPATENIMISRSGNAPVTLRLYNVLGSLAFSEVINTQNHTLNISDYPAGIYFLQIGNSTKKIVKQ